MTVSGWTMCCMIAAVVGAPLSAQGARGIAGESDRRFAAAQQGGEAAPLTFFQLPARESFSGAQALNAGPSRAELRAAAVQYEWSLPVDRRRARAPRDRIVPPWDRKPAAEPEPPDQFTTVPEPSTMVLLGTALIALAAATVVRRARAARPATEKPPR
jgi:hypothetical protein